ncbi:MAG TPA: CopG family transcriptional regulator [Gammaproteobacteria bacterium]|nr:CopG family transcriptional regulator [Gammaproteobacteria bacterium]
MTVITVRLSDKLLRDLDRHADAIHLPRAEYIRLSIENMNVTIKKKEQIERLKKASLLVRNESMRVNKEFDRIEHDPKD